MFTGLMIQNLIKFLLKNIANLPVINDFCQNFLNMFKHLRINKKNPR